MTMVPADWPFEPTRETLAGPSGQWHPDEHTLIKTALRQLREAQAQAAAVINTLTEGLDDVSTETRAVSRGGTGVTSRSALLDALGFRSGSFNFTFQAGQPHSVVHTISLGRPIRGISVQAVNGSSMPIFVVLLTLPNAPGSGQITMQARFASGVAPPGGMTTPGHYLALVDPT